MSICYVSSSKLGIAQLTQNIRFITDAPGQSNMASGILWYAIYIYSFFIAAHNLFIAVTKISDAKSSMREVYTLAPAFRGISPWFYILNSWEGYRNSPPGSRKWERTGPGIRCSQGPPSVTYFLQVGPITCVSRLSPDSDTILGLYIPIMSLQGTCRFKPQCHHLISKPRDQVGNPFYIMQAEG